MACKRGCKKNDTVKEEKKTEKCGTKKCCKNK